MSNDLTTTYGEDLLIFSKDVELVLGTAMLNEEFGTIKAAAIRRTGEREVITDNIGEVLLILMKTPGFEMTLKCAFSANVIAPAMGERLTLPFVGMAGYVMEGVTVEWEAGTERGMSIPVSSWDSMTEAVAYRYTPGAAQRTTLGSVAVPAPTLAPALMGAAEVFINTLSWPAVARAADYEVQMRRSNTQEWSALVITANRGTAHEGRVPYDIFVYRVRARNSVGNGPWSDEVTLTTIIPLPATAPVLTALAGLSYQPGVSWPAVLNAEVYAIERTLNNGSTWSELATVNAPTVTWRNQALALGGSHTIRVRARNSQGDGPASEPLTQTGDRLAVPVITGAPAAGIVTLTWPAIPAVSGQITRYRVEASDDNGATWTLLNTVTATQYVHAYVSSTETFKYRVRAQNNTEATAWSNVVTCTGVGLPKLTLNRTVGLGAVYLTWQGYFMAGSLTNTFELQTSDDGGATWTALSPSTNSFTHTYVSAETERSYRLRLTNAEDTGAWSDVITARTPGVPTPVLTQALATSSGTVEIRYTGPWAGNPFLRIESSADGGATWSLLTEGTNLKAGYNVSGLSNGDVRSYRVREEATQEVSAWSNVITATVTALPVIGLITTTFADPDVGMEPTDDVVLVSFPTLAGATYYELRYGLATTFATTSEAATLTVRPHPSVVTARLGPLARPQGRVPYTIMVRALINGSFNAWSSTQVRADLRPLAPTLAWDSGTKVLTITLSTPDDPDVRAFSIQPLPASDKITQTGNTVVVDLSEFTEQINTGQPGYELARVRAVRQAGWRVGAEATAALNN